MLCKLPGKGSKPWADGWRCISGQPLEMRGWFGREWEGTFGFSNTCKRFHPATSKHRCQRLGSTRDLSPGVDGEWMGCQDRGGIPATKCSWLKDVFTKLFNSDKKILIVQENKYLY